MTAFTEPEEEENEEDLFFGNAKQRGKNMNKLVSRKDGSRACLFPTTLNKIDEVDESRFKSPDTSDIETDRPNDNQIPKDENGNVKASPHVMWKTEDEVIHIHNDKRRKPRQRPKSANCVSTAKSLPMESSVRKRPKSSCALLSDARPSRIPVAERPPKSVLKNRRSDSDSTSSSSSIAARRRPSSAGEQPLRSRCASWEEVHSDELDSLVGFDECHYPARPTSACGIRTPSCTGRRDWVSYTSGHFSEAGNPRRCRSNPNICTRQSKASAKHEKDMHRFRRSLKLLGLEPSDFGICDLSPDSRRSCHSLRLKDVEPTFTTKILKRSMSLDCLREAVREASLDDSLDITHRRLLAQAAYEEWYFKKKEEAHRRREEERAISMKVKERLELEFRDRKTKAEEHFQKWVESKNTRKKSKSSGKAVSKNQFRVVKTKEESDKAYQEWKKEKDKEFEKKHKQKLETAEKKSQEEKQKEEKKAQAEKAFQEWKKKLIEHHKMETQAKIEKEKKEKEHEEKTKMQENRPTSFQMWKDIKDQEIKQKLQKARTTARVTRATRSAQVAERIYEAEQAFEDWLDKVELRRHKQMRNVMRSREKVSSKHIVLAES